MKLKTKQRKPTGSSQTATLLKAAPVQTINYGLSRSLLWSRNKISFSLHNPLTRTEVSSAVDCSPHPRGRHSRAKHFSRHIPDSSFTLPTERKDTLHLRQDDPRLKLQREDTATSLSILTLNFSLGLRLDESVPGCHL